ncbi:MAG: DNA repair protein RecO [Pseudomonadota bacterium]
MDWRDQGPLLSVRPHGETSVIAEVFTAEHGRHVGVIRGGTSRKIAPLLQPGTQLDVAWRARLEDHIGTFTVEPLKSRVGQIIGDRLALAALASLCALLGRALPEREPHPGLYRASVAVLDALGEVQDWPVAYLLWEKALLADLGFGLDLEKCAVTGTVDGLVYVSPRTGRAVSEQGAGAYADRLLPLPPALSGLGGGTAKDVVLGLSTTGHFLARALPEATASGELPAARQRFAALLAKAD